DLCLSASQLAAYREIRKRRVVTVWGPPGTGKTHFLAAAILGLADAHAAANRPFRVLLTAFTHAAIENLLRKIEELRASNPRLAKAAKACKVKGWYGDGEPAGLVVAEDRLVAWLESEESAIAGATVYACIKAGKNAELPPFDLVVIDEASQVRVAESAI